MLRRAQRRGCYDALHRAELGAFLRAQHTAYDLVVCADTLCYLGDLAEVTPAAAGALRPGGILVATVERLDDGAGDWRLTPSGRYAHGAEYLRRCAAPAGLRRRGRPAVSPPSRGGRPGRGTAVVGAPTHHGERS